MKKLLCLGFTALMMLFAVPNVVRADEGETPEPTTPATTLPTPTFTPTSGTLTQGGEIKFDIPTDYADAMVFVFYVFNQPDATLEATYEDILDGMPYFQNLSFKVALNNMGTSAMDGDDAEEAGWALPCVVPSNVSGNVTFRARMVTFVGEEGQGDPTAVYSDYVTATFTVEAGEAETIPAPTFNPEAGQVAFGTTVQIGENLNDLPVGMVQYTAYRVIDNADFDFSQYTDLDDAEADGASSTESYRVVKAVTIKAATAKQSMDGLAWSEPATASYTVTAPNAPTFTPAAGAVTAGMKVKIKSSHNPTFGAAIVDIYYTTDGTEPSVTNGTKGTYNNNKEVEVEITEAMTIKAIAVGVADPTLISTVAEAAYTIEETPAPTPEAVTFTITPAPSEEGLEAGTEITVACSDATLDIYYQWFATKEAADEATTLEDGEWAFQTGAFVPVLTESKPVLKVFAVNEDEDILADSVVVYTIKETPVGPEKLDVKIDFMTDAYGQARFAKKSDKIRLVPENYDYDALDTMMYAIVTVTDEEESEATYVGYTEELISLTDVEGNFRVKAYGKKGDKTTDVYNADFVLLDIINPTLSFDTATGKNYPVAFNVTSISYPDIMDKDMYVYYSLDGTTEPSDTAFLNGNEALKYINREDGQWKTFLELTENTTVWAKAYVMVDNDAEIVLETPAVKQLVKVNSLPNPVITPAVAATEYNAGDSIKVAIQMPEDAEYDYVYYTLDGSEPLYSRLVENDELFDSVIFVYEPWFENFDTIVVKKSTTIKAIAYKEAAYRPFVPAAGSDIVSATFGFKAELTFDPASGSEVYEGTRVAINSADETIDIYYMMFESEEAAKAAEWDQEKAALYTSEMQPVISKKNTTIKAAYLHTGAAAVTGSYCYATYTVKERPAVTLTLDPADGAEVEANTKVTVTASRELLEGEDIIFVMFADKKAADTCSDMDMVMNGIYYGEPDEAGEYGYPVITKDAPVLKVGVLGAMDENGNFTYNWIIAEYKIKGEGPVQANEAGELAGVNVYPNPSNGTFNVAVPEKARIDIFGLNGAKVMSREANAGVETFSINHSGIYFVRVMAGNKAAVKRVVVR